MTLLLQWAHLECSVDHPAGYTSKALSHFSHVANTRSFSALQHNATKPIRTLNYIVLSLHGITKWTLVVLCFHFPRCWTIWCSHLLLFLSIWFHFSMNFHTTCFLASLGCKWTCLAQLSLSSWVFIVITKISKGHGRNTRSLQVALGWIDLPCLMLMKGCQNICHNIYYSEKNKN